MTSAQVTPAAERSLLQDLVMLTKPRIISLLLVTTIAPMFVAGSPGWLLVLIVGIGGYLMAGGANAVNMYMDRDIDDRMARTRLRPIPSGRMSGISVLAFGVALATAATFLFAYFVNVLSAALALGGFYFYVFIYTRWLKRTTPQNIVIGGAAGAFPPLVGWAAMTGGIDLVAVYLFLIVFYWTPPHFWALALLKQGDYARAGVPMAPLVWGERETMNQMLWYTLILIPLTVLPFTFGAFGLLYLVSAVLLGLILLVGVVRMRAAREWTAPAWWVYKYSLLYLALLFVAMAADRKLAGHDVRTLSLEDLRGAIGMVPQEPALFSGTVRENIAYALTDDGRMPPDEDIRRAASAAHATEFIDRMVEGFDTLVGERGVKLSGGQRQRLAIARVFLKDPAIVILDEATSSLDSESERLVEQAMQELLRGRSTMIIAHRLSTVLRADRVVVLDRGRVVEEGRHAELVASEGVYSRLYRGQFRDDEAFLAR